MKNLMAFPRLILMHNFSKSRKQLGSIGILKNNKQPIGNQ